MMFFDIDTQIDFLFPAGKLYAPGAERILPLIERLNRCAIERGIPLVSTVCAHGEDDAEFQIWGAHCVLGTVGQTKPASLMVGQTILPKRETDMFTSPELLPLLERTDATEFVVYGVVTEVCVRQAAEGLLRTGKPVTIVTDAVWPADSGKAESFLKSFAAAGGRLDSSQAVLGRSFTVTAR